MLAAAAVISLVAVIGVHAEDANVNTNVNAGVNANDNVPPTPTLYSNDNVNAPEQTPPSQDNPPGEVAPPTHDNGTAVPPAGAVHPQPRVGADNNGAPQTGDKHVKILHPDYIKFFQDIKKVGDSLFGVLKKEAGGIPHGDQLGSDATTGSGDQTTAPKTDSTTGDVNQPTEQQLEKILSPDMIKFFTSIKKMGTSLFGVRKGGDQKKSGKAYRVVTADESACVITAITAKDKAIVDAKTAETTAFTAAVSARTACQTTALGSTENQGSAIEQCNKTFATTVIQGQQTFAKAQKDAWTAFTAAAKTCTVSTTTSTGDIVVPDGSNTLPQPQPLQQ